MTGSTLLDALRARRDELFGIDLRSLAALRIALAGLVLADLALRASDLRAHYSDAGVLPRADLAEIGRAWGDAWWFLSLHALHGSSVFAGSLFVLHALAAIALGLGLRTRIAAFVCWVLELSLQARNPAVLQGGDVLLRMLLFWGLFLPWGALASLDAVGRRRQAAPGQSQPAPARRAVSFGTAACLGQVALVYGFAAALKAGPQWRTQGTAIYYALSIDQFATPLGRLLLEHLSFALKPLTFTVFGLEAVAPLLLFFPLATTYVRTAAVVALLGLQLGLGLSFELGSFPWTNGVALLPFVPGFLWDWVVRLGAAQRSVELARAAGARLAGWLGSTTSASPATRFAIDPFAALFFAYVLIVNLETLPGYYFPLPVRVRAIESLLKLGQHWDLFSFPPQEDGWYVIPGELRDGSRVDLWAQSDAVSLAKPADVSRTYPNFRWRKYMMNLLIQRYAPQRSAFARYLCRDWNAANPGSRELLQLEIVYVLERTLPGGSSAEPEPLTLIRQACQEPTSSR